MPWGEKNTDIDVDMSKRCKVDISRKTNINAVVNSYTIQFLSSPQGSEKVSNQ